MLVFFLHLLNTFLLQIAAGPSSTDNRLIELERMVDKLSEELRHVNQWRAKASEVLGHATIFIVGGSQATVADLNKLAEAMRELGEVSAAEFAERSAAELAERLGSM